MSKRRMLRWTRVVLVCAILALISSLIHVAVTLSEENKELKVENTKTKSSNTQLQLEVDNLKGTVDHQTEDIQILKEEIQGQYEINKKLKDDNDKLQSELKKEKERADTLSQMPSRGEGSSGTSFYVEATAYTALCNEGCTGITATGINLLKNRNAKVIAVDPSVIPLGSKVYVEGYGHAIAGDTGGAIKGYKIDLHVPTERIANQWGRKKVKITILK